jgi:hypothetical protein
MTSVHLKKPLLIFCLAFFSLASCAKHRQVNMAFFYWQKEFSLSSDQLSYLGKLQTKRLYIKFFDVDWDQELKDAVPLAKIEFISPLPGQVAIVPCIYITNRAIENTKEEDIQILAGRISKLLKTLQAKNTLPDFDELQLDCDWTLQTREKYFALLRQVKKLITPAVLSATIRLHQVKYLEKTGVPPVDRGLVMFYNMASLEQTDTGNSILDLEQGEKYIDNLGSYPLDIDIALPAFSWAVLLRFNKITGLIHNVTLATLKNTENLEQVGKNRFKAKNSFYFDGYYLYKDDILRYENAEIAMLQKAAEMLAAKVRNRNLNIVFFHLNQQLIEEYSYEELESVRNRFN